ncbi:phosphatidate cytidylyltransferase [Cryptosporangium minutisporangium]|uniref:Phosphatidate cytidylyltransferase n=1 Tax=Cryptosporangium minutisporangium TaxID=113569 RepID=A0ABP6T2C4_9ACTN
MSEVASVDAPPAQSGPPASAAPDGEPVSATPATPATPAAESDAASTPPADEEPDAVQVGPPLGAAVSTASRAGRNLPAAIGVGVGLAALIVVTLFTSKLAFAAVIAGAVGVGIWELVRAIRPVEARPPMVPLIVGGVATIGMTWAGGTESLLLGLLLTVVAVLIWRLPDGPVGFQRDVTAAVLVAAYVPFLAGFAVLLEVEDDGVMRIVAFIATVVCSDVGGYAAGVLAGRHPMAPTVSPKKSWEGMAGSLIACAIAGAAFLELGFDNGAWWEGVVYGLAIAVAATLGDLTESMIKRDLGVKDMSSLLPGHGGLMDRLDSLLFAAPVAYLLLTAFAPAA